MGKNISFLCLVFLSSVVLWQGMADAELSGYAIPRITSDCYYDDNIYFASSDVISDFVTRVAPGVEAGLSFNTWNLDLDYELQQVFFYHQSARNSLNHFLDLDGWLDLSHDWKVSIEDSFIHSKDPVQISKSIGAISYEDLKYDYNEANVKLFRSFNDKGRAEIGYKNMFFKNHSSIGADTVNHFPYMELRYWLRPQYGIGMETGANMGLFDTSDDFTEPRGALAFFYRLDLDTTLNVRGAVASMNFSGETPDYDTYDFTVGLTHAFNQSTGFTIGGGYYFQTRLHHAGLDNYDGVSWNATFWRHTNHYSLKIEISKGYDEVYFDGENLGFSSCYVLGGEVEYAILDRLHLSLESYYRDDTFPYAGGWDEKIRERTWNADLELYWQLNSWLETGISLSHWHRDANDPDYEYLDNRAMLTLRLSKEFDW